MAIYEELIPWVRKPIGSVKLNKNNPIAKKIGSGEIFGPFSKNKIIGLDKNVELALTGTTIVKDSAKGLGFVGSVNTNDGASVDSSIFSSHGWSELTVISIVYYKQNGVQTNELEMYRETTSLDEGVSHAFVSDGQYLRCLINTTGTKIWTTGQDVSLSGLSEGWHVFAFTWDGSTRDIYIAELGKSATLQRSDACTGTINIVNQSSAKSVVQGGLHSSALGYNQPQILTAILSNALTKNELDYFCKNPWSILQPDTISIPFGVSGGVQDISPSDIASLEAFGIAVIGQPVQDISPSEIISSEAFDTAQITPQSVDISPPEIGSTEAFDTASVLSGLEIQPSEIGSSETFDNATLTVSAVNIDVSSILSAETFDTASIITDQELLPVGIGTVEAFGTAELTGEVFLTPGSIASLEAFDSATLGLGDVSITPASIESLESFGFLTVSDGTQTKARWFIRQKGRIIGTINLKTPGLKHNEH